MNEEENKVLFMLRIAYVLMRIVEELTPSFSSVLASLLSPVLALVTAASSHLS